MSSGSAAECSVLQDVLPGIAFCSLRQGRSDSLRSYARARGRGEGGGNDGKVPEGRQGGQKSEGKLNNNKREMSAMDLRDLVFLGFSINYVIKILVSFELLTSSHHLKLIITAQFTLPPLFHHHHLSSALGATFCSLY